jgi:selenocysteine-specific elongation factor
VNLRGVEREEVGRGDALLTPRELAVTGGLDVRLSTDPRTLPAELVLHVGSTGGGGAAAPAR